MTSTRDEINAAIRSLGLSPTIFRALSDAEAQAIFQSALTHFVGGDDRRWWWEAFTDSSISRQVDDGWRFLTTLVPEPEKSVWFIAEDDQSAFYPVYDATPIAASQVIGECVGFEYYLVAKDMSWLLCENHHDMLIGVGEPIESRLAQLSI
jgi:hypothetical protein